MRVETNALFLYLSELCKGEHLKSAAVGENGLVPVHELVQTAHLLYHLVAGAHMKMISVAQLHLAFKVVFQVNGGNTALYGSSSSYVHKARGLECAVNSFKLSSSGFAFCFNKCVHKC